MRSARRRCRRRPDAPAYEEDGLAPFESAAIAMHFTAADLLMTTVLRKLRHVDLLAMRSRGGGASSQLAQRCSDRQPRGAHGREQAADEADRKRPFQAGP